MSGHAWRNNCLTPAIDPSLMDASLVDGPPPLEVAACRLSKHIHRFAREHEIDQTTEEELGFTSSNRYCWLVGFT